MDRCVTIPELRTFLSSARWLQVPLVHVQSLDIHPGFCTQTCGGPSTEPNILNNLNLRETVRCGGVVGVVDRRSPFRVAVCQ